VQQLLAALKQPQNGTAPPPSQPAPGLVPPPALPMPPISQPPPSANPYYPPSMQQPAHPYSAIPSQSTSPYGQMLPQTQTPPGQAGMGTLPPNILALLQQSAGQQPQLAPQQSSVPQYGMPPPPPQMMSPPPMSSLPPGAPQPGGPGYQQLMSFLVSGPRVSLFLPDQFAGRRLRNEVKLHISYCMPCPSGVISAALRHTFSLPVVHTSCSTLFL
jgi:hypothetical protein